jgi:hypothetical protein
VKGITTTFVSSDEKVGASYDGPRKRTFDFPRVVVKSSSIPVVSCERNQRKDEQTYAQHDVVSLLRVHQVFYSTTQILECKLNVFYFDKINLWLFSFMLMNSFVGIILVSSLSL